MSSTFICPVFWPAAGSEDDYEMVWNELILRAIPTVSLLQETYLTWIGLSKTTVNRVVTRFRDILQSISDQQHESRNRSRGNHTPNGPKQNSSQCNLTPSGEPSDLVRTVRMTCVLVQSLNEWDQLQNYLGACGSDPDGFVITQRFEDDIYSMVVVLNEVICQVQVSAGRTKNGQNPLNSPKLSNQSLASSSGSVESAEGSTSSSVESCGSVASGSGLTDDEPKFDLKEESKGTSTTDIIQSVQELNLNETAEEGPAKVECQDTPKLVVKNRRRPRPSKRANSYFEDSDEE